ncbi:GNAT family N-acetyltransferase [Streptomyces sp. SLBN-31]|uniref:GNAT family N-acetyltransferase n=1 Tax=Streptomyces sp. SLBN-31 TaxID=2768444 RepID=UPI00114F4132|nr:RimJ/RimL family protein N-acetyltransferase [Streptomyces sp. SLBN-31]
MPPTDASAHAAPATGTDSGDPTGTCPAESSTDVASTPVAADREAADTAAADCEDTLDLRLPDELLALLEEQGGADDGPGPDGGTAPHLFSATAPHRFPATIDHDLLDRVAEWGPVATPVGTFHLVPVAIERDLPLITRWMNDPAVAEFWELAGAESVTGEHLRAQLDGDGRSVPCVGVLEGTPMSYWEIYRADLDPLARHYPARPHDTGVHLLIGEVADRGRGLGSALLRAVADLALDRRPACARVVAEPALRNTPSVAAFLTAGFRFSAEVDLPDKRAALMVRDRTLRDLL